MEIYQRLETAFQMAFITGKWGKMGRGGLFFAVGLSLDVWF